MPPEFEHYLKVEWQADVHLAATNLEWVIVRPGTLTNAPGTGRVRLGLAIPYDEVSRDHLAASWRSSCTSHMFADSFSR